MRSTRRASSIRVTAWSAATLAVALATLSGLPAQASQADPAPAAARGSAASPSPATTALVSRATAALASPSDTGASDLVNLGARRLAGGQQRDRHPVRRAISKPGFSARSWLPVTNDDAGAPGTEIEALLQNGALPGRLLLRPT